MNLLITGAFNCSKEEIKIIENKNNCIIYLQNEADDIQCDYNWIEGIICNNFFSYHDIKLFKNLKYIQLTSAGTDRVPIEYIKEKGIVLYNARGVYSIPMAEFAISSVLDFYKNKQRFYEQQSKHIWEKQRKLKELHNKNVCIVGCGSVGIECAKLFKAFECNIIGVDIIEKKNVYFSKIYSLLNIKEVLNNSDIVILTLPLTSETNNLFNIDLLREIKDGGLLINISRGKIVNTNDLIYSLQNNLGGAILDVFEDEPLNTNSDLWDIENLIVTPHNCFEGENNHDRLFALVIKNLEDNI